MPWTWLGRAISLVLTLILVGITSFLAAAFIVSGFDGFGFFVSCYTTLLGAVPSILLVTVPSLFLFDRARVTGWVPRVALGAITGVVASIIGIWMLSGKDSPISFWSFIREFSVLGAGVGLVGTLFYWKLESLVAGYIARARELRTTEKGLESLPSDVRRKLTSRLDRSPWS